MPRPSRLCLVIDIEKLNWSRTDPYLQFLLFTDRVNSLSKPRDYTRAKQAGLRLKNSVLVCSTVVSGRNPLLVFTEQVDGFS